MPMKAASNEHLRRSPNTKGRLTSDERIAAFAAWFAEQEVGWKDFRKDPPIDMALVLLKDSKLNVVRLGYRTSGGGWCVSDQPMRFVPQVWARIP